jgi:23S rRNA (pseudouridine1915-N3)-methyltransferase
MNLKIIAVDKIRDRFVEELISEYSKKTKRLKIVEVDKSNIEEEGTRILKQTEITDFVVALDLSGKQLTSEDFAKFLKDNEEKNLVFVIGGAYGLSENVLKKASRKISLSKMTLPHELCRLFLVEQIYRAQSILEGKSYHK